MSEFRDRLNAAGLLHPEDDPQQAANDGLMREYQADRVTQQRLPDGSVVVRLSRHDEDRPVARAVVSLDGQVQVDVTVVIA